MRPLPLTLACVLLVLACGDDLPDQAFSTGSSSAAGSTTTTGSSGVAESTTVTEMPTTTASTSLVESTGPGSMCGNGILEDGEECDDENVLEDDDCYSNCTIPFAERWTATHDGGGADFANHALFDAEGNLYVLGVVDVAGQDDIWLRQYGPDGREGFTWTYDGELEADDYGRRMAWLPSGDLVIVGTQETEANGDDVLVLRLAMADQSIVWSRLYDGQGSGPDPIDNDDFGDAITVDGDGNVLVSASMRVDGQEYDMWLSKLDPDGNPLWVHEYDNPDFHGADTSDAVLTATNGDVYLVGNTEVAPSMVEAWVRKLDLDGAELWTQMLPEAVLTNGTLDPGGNLVLVGRNVNPKNYDMWAGKYDADLVELAITTYDGPMGQFDVALGVATGGGGDVFMTGYITVVGEQSNIWVGRYMSSLGLRWWSDSYGNSKSLLADDGRAVAVSDDDSRVAVVGYESVIGEDLNVWVRVYDNNAAPLAQ